SAAPRKVTCTRREKIAREALNGCFPAMEGKRKATGRKRALGLVTSRLASRAEVFGSSDLPRPPFDPVRRSLSSLRRHSELTPYGNIDRCSSDTVQRSLDE